LISISIVVYRAELTQLKNLFESISKAANKSREKVFIYLIDNGNDNREVINEILGRYINADTEIELIAGHGNIGFGKGHNLVLEKLKSEYHLILNPDIEIDEQCLIEGIKFFSIFSDAVILTPKTKDGIGKLQYTSKKQPVLLDLISKFLPGEKFRCRNNKYAYVKEVNKDKAFEVDIACGCFLFCKSEILKKVGGFDERYFLYFEDYALSNEVRKFGKIYYVPQMKIIHLGGDVYRKGIIHIFMYLNSCIKYFDYYGWKLR
jgi:GT2 family glycosyltransferase